VIFGSAKAGTPLMLAAPEIALELPLRILVRERSDGRTDLVYIDPSRLAEDFGVGELAPAIAGLAAIAHAAAEWRLPDVLLTCASEQDPEQPFGRGSKDQMRGEVRCELGAQRPGLADETAVAISAAVPAGSSTPITSLA
jgi:hypothetical protein